MRSLTWLAALAIPTLAFGCSSGGTSPEKSEDPPEQEYANPFLDPGPGGKEDTGYVNVRGVEVHATLEADVEASEWQILDSPPDLAQYAVTTMRKKQTFYLEILAEDPFERGWMIKIKLTNKDDSNLLSAAAYEELLAKQD